MPDYTHPLTDPAARVTITIEIGADPDHPRVQVSAPEGCNPDEMARMLDAARAYVGQLETVKSYQAVSGTLPLFPVAAT